LSPGDRVNIKTQVVDARKEEPFAEISLEVVVDPPRKKSSPTPGGKKGKEEGNDKEKEGRFKQFKEGGDTARGINLPKIVPLWKDNSRWTDHFGHDNDAVDPVRNGDQIDVYINMSNRYLREELESSKPGEKFVLENQFKYGIALVSLAMYYDSLEKAETPSEGNTPSTSETAVFNEIRDATRAIAMVILPLTNSLGSVSRSLT